jgi:translocation and assembly module TamB
VPAASPSPNRPLWHRTIIGVTAAIMVVLIAISGAYLWLDTNSGKRFLIRQIEGYAFENGLKLSIGSLEGSVYDRLIINNLRFADPLGVFASAPRVVLDWRPWASLKNGVTINRLETNRAILSRMPQFKLLPAANEPLLPDIDIVIGRLHIAALEIDPAITSQSHRVAITARVNIADRKARVFATARATKTARFAGGDRLDLVLDAVPGVDRFGLLLDIQAPADGLVAGFSKVAVPLSARITGKGRWSKWSGRLEAQSGGQMLATLALSVSDGRFAAKGVCQPGLMLPATDAYTALQPELAVDVKAELADRAGTIAGTLDNRNFVLAFGGGVDLRRSQISAMNVSFRVLHPDQLAENMSGKAITGSFVLDGAITRPLIDYRIRADTLSFNGMVIDALRARGRTRLDGEAMIIPVAATVGRISGLTAEAGNYLTQLQLNGDLAYANGRLFSDNMKIRSDRIDATAILVADMRSGRYTGALKGRINHYRIASIGIFNLETDAKVATVGISGFVLRGRIRARSVRLFDEGVRDFLGGTTLVAADLSYGSNGVANISSIRVAASAFRLTQGNAVYMPDGSIHFAGSGLSDRYGPLSAALAGTLQDPVVRIRADRPGFGLGLTNVDATIRRRGTGYAIMAKGNSDYGPFDGNFNAAIGNGPFAIDIVRANFASVALAGQINQTALGPYGGRVTLAGSGLNGTIVLSAVGNRQRAVVDATAQGARLSGRSKLVIGRGHLAADIILYDRPAIVADIDVVDASWGATSIYAGRAKIAYRGGAGSAKILADGRNAVPFRVAANAELAPKLWRIAITGRADGIDFRTERPAIIVPQRTFYMLQPANILLDRGRVKLAGKFGRGLSVKSQLQNVDLAVLNPLYPGLGLGGIATGTIDFTQGSKGAFPKGEARLMISRFSRSSAAVTSKPFDVALLAQLDPAIGKLRANIRRGAAVIGRLQLDLRHQQAGGGSWITRLSRAPLSGGVRFNGPADILFSLAGLPDQQLTGPLGVAADFSGRADQPLLTGVMRANALTYENGVYGTKLTQMRLRGTFTNDQLEVTELTARAGKGTVSGTGFVSLSSKRGFPLQLNLTADNAKLANSSDLAASTTGTLLLVNAPGAPPTITGRLLLPETRYRILRQGRTKVATLTGIRRKPTTGRQTFAADAVAIGGLPKDWLLDIQLIADNKVFVSGMGLESEWSAKLDIRGTSGAPRISGQMDMIRGTLGFAGRSFKLAEGHVSFDGSQSINPALILAANSDIDGVTTKINITGRAYDPHVLLTSTPNLPQDEVLARILFGNSVADLSAIQAIQLAASLNSLRSGGGGFNPLSVLQSAAGIDRLRILAPDQETGRSTAVALGKYISNDVYVEIVTDARGFTATQIEVTIARGLSILSQVSSFGGSNANIRYRKDY